MRSKNALNKLTRLLLAASFTSKDARLCGVSSSTLAYYVKKKGHKPGVTFDELPMIFDFVKKLPRIKLRGLACSPKKRQELEAQREPFKRMKEAFEKSKQNGHPEIDTLCMGNWNAVFSTYAGEWVFV